MMVTFVSQCEKKALNRTRRVLDAFADRIGDNTWQTVITQEGLLAVKKLLRKTASKNTAVSCHWIRSRSRSELVWVVGNKGKFNAQGAVPVNSTSSNKALSNWENKWQHAHSIQVLATLAALLHDVGKATIGFQRKLDPKFRSLSGDPYRHEWISLKIFLAIIVGCEDDEAWLKRLLNLEAFFIEQPDWLGLIEKDKDKGGLNKVPPLAQLVGWLIVTHHRLPFYNENYWQKEVRSSLRVDTFYLESTMEDFYLDLNAVDHWVRNPKNFDERSDIKDFWTLKAPIVVSKPWQKAVARWASKALNHAPLMLMAKKPVSDPFVMHLSRLCLMVGDHNFSSLTKEQSAQVKGDSALETLLIANTDRKTATPKQALDQHLLGVAQFTAKFSRLLPQLSSHLPTIEKFEAKAFNNRTSVKRFLWQNQSFDLALKLKEETQAQGFFGVNMASTGCGKTLANARIMYALADPELGARFTIALGLRVLTLQTGNALRSKLNLNYSNLAVLIGSAASRKLFELNVPDNTDTNIDESDELARMGSESLAELVDEIVQFGDSGFDDSVLGTVIENPKARDLLFAPIVSCTIDHIISASENTRGGKHIAPMLRLLSSDLVLDEPDDFGQSDMPALSRLVHFAGMFGSRVLLSSATLTPDLTSGLFSAYQAGRKIWNQHMGFANQSVVCAWFDEHKQTSISCGNTNEFLSSHNTFTKKRAVILDKTVARRIAEILPVSLPPAPESQRVHYEGLAKTLMDAAQTLHHRYNETQNLTGKTASVGLIRFANVGPLVELVKAIYRSAESVKDTQIHLCCYHARQLLVLRSALEEKLDRILSRSDTSSLFDHREISEAVGASDKMHHVFIVLATPVAEVGRDHDYDWAIIEPSSMRSIIQLAGRVWRHRPEKLARDANILIMEANIKALKYGKNLGVGEAVFSQPGFEDKDTKFLLETHQASELITSRQLAHINSTPRIVKTGSLAPSEQLADLEHAVMADLLNNAKPNVVNAFWKESNGSRAGVHLQKISPFREQSRPQNDYVCLPDNQQESGFSFMAAEKAWENGGLGATINQWVRFSEFNTESDNVSPWLNESLSSALVSLSEKLDYDEVQEIALRYATVRLEDQDKGWNFNHLLGFWQGG